MMLNIISYTHSQYKFENYQPHNDGQKDALKKLKALAGFLSENVNMLASSADVTEHFSKASQTCSSAQGALIFIQGGCGTGKTHILDALVNELKQAAPAAIGNIYYTREAFEDRLFTPGSPEEMHDECEHRAVVILDGFSSVRSSLDRSGLHTYKTLSTLLEMAYEKKCLVVLSSVAPLADELIPFLKKHNAPDALLVRAESLIENGRHFSANTSGPNYRDNLRQQYADNLQVNVRPS